MRAFLATAVLAVALFNNVSGRAINYLGTKLHFDIFRFVKFRFSLSIFLFVWSDLCVFQRLDIDSCALIILVI